MRCLALSFVIAVVSAEPVLSQSYWGKFDDGPIGRFRDADPWQEFVVEKDFSFHDPNGLTWTTPSGTVVNGASIPSAFWSFIGGPFTGKYLKASVIHDHFVVVRNRTAHDTHRNFYYGMRANGVPAWRAKTMYWAVRTFGEYWDVEDPATASASPENGVPYHAEIAGLEKGEINVSAAYARQVFLEVARNLKTTDGEVLRRTFSGEVPASLEELDEDAKRQRLAVMENQAMFADLSDDQKYMMMGFFSGAGIVDRPDLTLDTIPVWPDGNVPVSGGSMAMDNRLNDLFNNDGVLDLAPFMEGEVPG